MENNVMTLIIQDNQLEIRQQNPMAFSDILQVFLTATLLAANTALKTVPAQHQQQVKEHFYDEMNANFSATLSRFAPEIEMRPGLTEQAILEMENQIIAEGRAPALDVPNRETRRKLKRVK